MLQLKTWERIKRIAAIAAACTALLAGIAAARIALGA